MGGCISDNSFKNCVDINLWIYCGCVGSQIMQYPLISSNYSLYVPVQKNQLRLSWLWPTSVTEKCTYSVQDRQVSKLWRVS